MKKILACMLSIIAFSIILTGCDKNAIEIETIKKATLQTNDYTTLGSPFHGSVKWSLTQAFGAYYDDPRYLGHHNGEDWKYHKADENDVAAVYPIAAGEVVDWGEALSKKSDGKSAGFYIIVKHIGTFKIPKSSGAHICALSKPDYEAGRASYKGMPMIYSKDIFGMGILTDYDLGEDTDNGNYSYTEENVDTIYSVYMHIQNPKDYINGLVDSKITDDMLDEPIGILMENMTAFNEHFHFEIRVGNEDEIKRSVLTAQTQSGVPQKNGYFPVSQDMIVLGYREPSSIIQANNGQEDMVGEVLGAAINNLTVTPEADDGTERQIYAVINNLEKVNGKAYASYDDFVYVAWDDTEGIKELEKRNLELNPNDYGTYDDTPGKTEKSEINDNARFSIVDPMSDTSASKEVDFESFYNELSNRQFSSDHYYIINFKGSIITEIVEMYTP